MNDKINQLIESGVKFVLPETCFVDPEVEIEAGAIIGPNVQLLGKTKICSGAELEGTSYIKDTSIGANTVLRFACRVESAKVGSNCLIGAFVYIRPLILVGKKTDFNQKPDRIIVGDNAVIEAGAVIEQNAPKDSLIIPKNENRIRFSYSQKS